MKREQRKRIYRLLRGKQGFTLVEIIVAIVIAGIVIAMSAGILISSSSLISNATNRDLDKQIADSVAKFTTDKIVMAKSVSVTAGTPDVVNVALNDALTRGNAIIYIGDESGKPSEKGYLYFRKAGPTDTTDSAINVFGISAYHGHTLALTYRVDKVDPDLPKAITILTSVYKQNELLAKSSRSTQILNAPLIPPHAANPATYPAQLPPLATGEWGGATTAIILEIN